jgi:hypothetical protein
MKDIYSSTFTPEQTVELQSMFQRCGFSGAEWVDIPAWLLFSVTVPALSPGPLLANQKQSAGETGVSENDETAGVLGVSENQAVGTVRQPHPPD